MSKAKKKTKGKALGFKPFQKKDKGDKDDKKGNKKSKWIPPWVKNSDKGK